MNRCWKAFRSSLKARRWAASFSRCCSRDSPAERAPILIAIYDGYHGIMKVSVAEAKNKLAELIKAGRRRRIRDDLPPWQARGGYGSHRKGRTREAKVRHAEAPGTGSRCGLVEADDRQRGRGKEPWRGASLTCTSEYCLTR